MNVAVIGGGGREHAIAWALSKSDILKKLYVIPGNGGISQLAECVDIPIKYPFADLIEFLKKNTIEFVVVGPENPLADGIVDILTSSGIITFGPSKSGAMLESSKSYAKEFMKKAKIPTASYRVFKDISQASSYIESLNFPIVIKADGLAYGKGVAICYDTVGARQHIESIMLHKRFGSAGESLIIEDYIEGDEITILAITDGKGYKLFVPSQDHKRLLDNDEGPNTGGMGAYAPTPLFDDKLKKSIIKRIVEPTISQLSKNGIEYRGIIYFGLMIDKKKNPYVLEYNVRFGDPEAEVVLPLIDFEKTDFLNLLYSCAKEKLPKDDIHFKDMWAVDVVLASAGYPGEYEKGKQIKGLTKIKDEAIVFHSATSKRQNGFFTNGGRVLNIVGIGRDFKEARENAYNAVSKINFSGMHYRKDIGMRYFNYTK